MAKAPSKASEAKKAAKAAADAEANPENNIKQPHGSITAVMSLPPPTGIPIRPPTKGYR